MNENSIYNIKFLTGASVISLCDLVKVIDKTLIVGYNLTFGKNRFYTAYPATHGLI